MFVSSVVVDRSASVEVTSVTAEVDDSLVVVSLSLTDSVVVGSSVVVLITAHTLTASHKESGSDIIGTKATF